MKEFKEFSDRIFEALGSAKTALKNLEDEAEKAEQRKSDAEIKIKYAEQSYDEIINKNSAYMKEFNEKKEKVQKELEILKKETVSAHQQAMTDKTQTEKLLKETIRKEEQVSNKLEEIEKIRIELEAKKQRAKELVQAI